MAGGSNSNSPRTPGGGVLVASPVQAPRFCLPMFGGGRRRRLRAVVGHRRARTMDTVPSVRKEVEEQGQGQPMDALGASSSRTTAAQWPWLTAGAAGGVEQGQRRRTMDGSPRRQQQQQEQEQEQQEQVVVVVTAEAAASTMTTTTTVVASSRSTSSPGARTIAVAAASASSSTTTEVVVRHTHVAPAGGAAAGASAVTPTPPVYAPAAPAALIPSESSSALADTNPNKPKVAFAASITASGSLGGSATPPQTQAAARRRGPLRSHSLGAMPTGKPPMAPASSAASFAVVDPHERYYPPALRKRDSLGDSSTTGSFIDELAPSLGALRNRFSASQRRRSFAGSTAHSRRQSLEEVTTVREDFVFRAGTDAPLLPGRLLPMVSHGMARLAINMKDAAMTPATWEVALSVLKVCTMMIVRPRARAFRLSWCWTLRPTTTLTFTHVHTTTTRALQPEDAAKVKRYRFEKDKRLALGSQLLQRAVVAWTFGVPYREIIIARTGTCYLSLSRCLSVCLSVRG